MIPLAKNIKRFFSLKELAIISLAIVVAVSAGVLVFMNLKKEVVIDDNGKQIVVKTMKTTVQEVLEQNGISVGPYDYISLKPQDKLQKIAKNEITIKRAIPVSITADGRTTDVMTYRDTVSEVLASNSISLGQLDRLDNLQPGDKVKSGMDIQVIRVKEEVEKEDTQVPFNVVTRENNKLDKGTEKTVREGKEGTREKLFRVVYEDGKQILKTLTSDTIISNPIDQIVEFGTILNFKTSRGETVRYRKVLNMRATAYTASYRDTGKNPGDPGFGITYTGMKVKKGVIAVDPRVIPLGSRVFVEVIGTNDYGFAVAADTGSAIKGDLIDLYFDDEKTVSRWGCKKVRVYMLVN